MIKLYDIPLSGNCYKVRLLLSQLDIPFETIPVKLLFEGARDSELLEKNVAGRAPVVVLEDGAVLAESNAILYYLARGTPYLEDAPLDRARVLRWMFFEQNSAEPNIAVARYLISIARQADRYEAVVDNRKQGGIAALKVMERHLQDHEFFGDTYSIADIALFAYSHVAPEAEIDLEPFPGVRDWLRRVEAQPGFVPML